MSTGPDVKATVGDISSDGNLNVAQEECSRKGFCSVRHGLALILQLCNFSIYTQQMNLSIAIPAMVNNTAPPSQPNASTERPSTDSQGYWNETLKEFKAMVMVLTGQYSIWVKWAPPLERSQLTTIAGSGSMLGSFIVLLAGGLLCQTIGWPYVFYIFGGIGCACCPLWFPLIYDDPVNHPFISAGEKRYIVCSLAQQDCSPGWSLPIRAMIKSLPLWAILVSYFCEYWLFYTIMAYTPTYISSVLQANLRDSGILSALPFVVGCICIILGGLLADFLLSRKILRLITIRKLFTAIGVLFPSVILVSLPWVRSSHSMTMTFLVLSSAISSFCESGALVNFLDIAPRYTGFLKGLLQVFAHIAGAISPTAAGFFISQDSEFGWRNVFLLSAAVNISGLVFYLIFGRADVQDWAKEQTFTHL
ncbi:putative small intestine urate exporter isoform X3 [Homo sapiens]|uniref:putative small intestine urate exporter isoform X3 n=1 Tax=Homo sapiens TaxID=9606 RepID=UPI0005D00408|nr:probable small intestine urate exporter isoform X3 [Homo sapiens]XP_054209957.1 probable small intestine urate exporter isoform X3 [Homo sapiens]|eukprot:XP_011512515.1 probable small intestine urate exporter isoform X3 [Homo sapiens]